MFIAKSRLLLAACAAVFAAALAGSASACSIASTNAQFWPVMPRYVHAMPIIVLARPLEARADLDGAVDDRINVGIPMGDTHIYEFETVEILKGTVPDHFQLRGGVPFGEDADGVCSDMTQEICRTRRANEFTRNYHHNEASNRRQNWRHFYSLEPTFRTGMGPALSYPPQVSGGGDCRSFAASFEIGENFLIFLSESNIDTGQQDRERYDLNHQLITRNDDAWLDAVRYFIANPDTDALPPQPFSTLMNALPSPFIIKPVECGVSDWGGFEVRASERVFTDRNGRVILGDRRASIPHDEATRLAEYCDGTREFVAFPVSETSPIDLALPPFPITDGKVDFSGMPGPWTFTEGELIPLEIVLDVYDAAHRNEE